MRARAIGCALGVAGLVAFAIARARQPDNLAWLEQENGNAAMQFVVSHDVAVESELGSTPAFRALEARIAANEASKDRFELPGYRGSKVRSFRTDAEHPRGLWRETPRADYERGNPTWTTLLDVDALSRKEEVPWVFLGVDCLPPAETRCLVRLSEGGGDASRRRELDTTTRDFVPGGFNAFGGIATWKDENTLYVGRDWGVGTETAAGYPRFSREWTRGTALDEAKTVFSVDTHDMRADCERDWEPNGATRDLCTRMIDMEHRQKFVLENGNATKLDAPDDATLYIFGDDVALRLRSAWLSFPAGALLATTWSAFRAGDHRFEVLYTPNAHTTLYRVATTKSHIVATILNDVREEAIVFGRADPSAPWVGTPLREDARGIFVHALDPETDEVWLELQDFVTPKSVVRLDLTTGARTLIATDPALFDASNLEVTQHFATSSDGTKVPYFEIGQKNRSAPGPTILSAYGGFGHAEVARYYTNAGPAWLARGGTYVSANIRGGGEYGAEWHRAAMGKNRQRSFDDMIAVAEDLERRGVTTRKQLGIFGFSNGGLLTSVMLTERPELFGAIVSRSPLTDMKNFTRFNGGAAYRGEYGDPDNADDWAEMSKWSPLQHIEAGKRYPPALYLSSTTDDRAHPMHARKAVALLERAGQPVLYFESAEGGHEGATMADTAHREALIYSFFATRLGLR